MITTRPPTAAHIFVSYHESQSVGCDTVGPPHLQTWPIVLIKYAESSEHDRLTFVHLCSSKAYLGIETRIFENRRTGTQALKWTKLPVISRPRELSCSVDQMTSAQWKKQSASEWSRSVQPPERQGGDAWYQGQGNVFDRMYRKCVTSRVWIDVKAGLLPDLDTSFRNILSIQFTKFFSRDAVLDNAAFPHARYQSFRGKEARNEAKI